MNINQQYMYMLRFNIVHCKMCIFVVLCVDETYCFICVNTVMRNILFISYVKPFGAVSKDTISR